ncbi:MAG: hypothetical protein JW867_02230 [Candidatus Omnitrophica bacterium]|nr:hypothetical protein [Candidatus Omnitrophota bacterium]
MIKDIKIKSWYEKNKNPRKNDVAKILGVEYAHLKLKNKSDIYITSYGLPFIENLKPENFWTDKKWLDDNSQRLSGTASVYKIRTKKVNGSYKDIVVKWNRMGQDVPGSHDCQNLINAEFNSPFEEFSLVMELRKAMGKSYKNVTIHKPLAIFVPSERTELWQTGRKRYKMQNILDSHKDVVLDIHRLYAVIYEWITGFDVTQAFDKKILPKKYMAALTIDAEKKMKRNGFLVRDNKPHHVIVRPVKKQKVARDRNKRVLYGLVDFELLERTPQQEKAVKRDKRSEYLKRQRDRFIVDMPDEFHPHLHHMNIFGVDYVYGHVESTKGRLWVVGKDPYLFDYFLPDRWRQVPRTKISVYSQMYHAATKDNIHLVWKVSKVGLQPDADPFREDEKKQLEYGYNSPFEEIAMAVELSKKGIASIYPRAIYMSEYKIKISRNLFDESRYKSHNSQRTPDGLKILAKGHDYIIIWGYWNGPDEKLAAKDSDYFEGIDALRAYKEKRIDEDMYINLLKTTKNKLHKEGIEDLNLRGNHILISYDSKGRLIKDNDGFPEIRICNFEFLKKLI